MAPQELIKCSIKTKEVKKEKTNEGQGQKTENNKYGRF